TFYKSSTLADPDYTVAESGANMIPEVDLPPATEHSEGSTTLTSDTNGVLEGEFEIPNVVNPHPEYKVRMEEVTRSLKCIIRSRTIRTALVLDQRQKSIKNQCM
ncbi:MAG: hypothetical protein EBT88_16380, partial [Proteobacteria bacterium]|nr:hypothetical protein [Pseudomonadota bacterium]